MKHAERAHRADPLPRGRAQPAAAVPAAASARRCPSSSQVDLAARVRRASSGSTAASPSPSSKGDNGTRELLADILVDEEEHVDWLETQLETIRQIGLEHYLAQQLHD